MVHVELLPKTKLVDLTTEIQFDLPDLDQDAIPHYMRRAAIRMAEVGKLMRRTVAIRTYKCVENYLIEPVDCVRVVSVLSVKNICGSTCREVTRIINHNPTCLCCGVRSWFAAPNVIYFSPAHEGWVYEVEVAVAPLPDACELDSLFVEKYFDTLILGTKAYLYDLDDKPWSSRAKAQDFRERFERSLRAAAIDCFMGGQSGVLHGPGRRIL